jgi:hypothetical protein
MIIRAYDEVDGRYGGGDMFSFIALPVIQIKI